MIGPKPTFSSDEIRHELAQHFTLVPTTETTGGPSRAIFRLLEMGTRVGFISPHSHNFCASCNRVRVTAEGRLLLCLGQEHSVEVLCTPAIWIGSSTRSKMPCRSSPRA